MDTANTPQSTGFTLEYDNGTITIPDTKNTMWFGEYHGGKLAIYKAILDINDEVEQVPLITIVAIYYDIGDKEFVLSVHYTMDTTPTQILADLMTRVIIEYSKAKAKRNPPSILMQGPSTLQ